MSFRKHFLRFAAKKSAYPESSKVNGFAIVIMDPVCANLITFQVIRCQRGDDEGFFSSLLRQFAFKFVHFISLPPFRHR
jgi:hypothetical protein